MLWTESRVGQQASSTALQRSTQLRSCGANCCAGKNKVGSPGKGMPNCPVPGQCFDYSWLCLLQVPCGLADVGEALARLLLLLLVLACFARQA